MRSNTITTCAVIGSIALATTQAKTLPFFGPEEKAVVSLSCTQEPAPVVNRPSQGINMQIPQLAPSSDEMVYEGVVAAAAGLEVAPIGQQQQHGEADEAPQQQRLMARDIISAFEDVPTEYYNDCNIL